MRQNGLSDKTHADSAITFLSLVLSSAVSSNTDHSSSSSRSIIICNTSGTKEATFFYVRFRNISEHYPTVKSSPRRYFRPWLSSPFVLIVQQNERSDGTSNLEEHLRNGRWVKIFDQHLFNKLQMLILLVAEDTRHRREESQRRFQIVIVVDQVACCFLDSGRCGLFESGALFRPAGVSWPQSELKACSTKNNNNNKIFFGCLDDVLNVKMCTHLKEITHIFNKVGSGPKVLSPSQNRAQNLEWHTLGLYTFKCNMFWFDVEIT